MLYMKCLNFMDLFYAVLMSFKVKINKTGVIECVFLKAILTLNSQLSKSN